MRKIKASTIVYSMMFTILIGMSAIIWVSLDKINPSSSNSSSFGPKSKIQSAEGITYKYAGSIDDEEVFKIFNDNDGRMMLYRGTYQQNAFLIDKDAVPIEIMIKYSALERGEITSYRGYKNFCDKLGIPATLEDTSDSYLVILYGSSYSKVRFNLVDVTVDEDKKTIYVYARKKEENITGEGNGVLVSIPLNLEDDEDYRIEFKKCYSEADMEQLLEYYGL